MPLYQKDNRIIHHIHVPKCGGTSVFTLLEENGWSRLNLPVPQSLEGEFHSEIKLFERNKEGWEPFYTAHEHAAVWREWFDGANIDPEFQFATIRNPYDRFNSQLAQIARDPSFMKFPDGFKSGAPYTLPPEMINGLLRTITPGTETYLHGDGRVSTSPLAAEAGWVLTTGNKGYGDNHYRPQVEFLSGGTHVYPLESTLDALLKELTERDIITPSSKLKKLNKRPANLNVSIAWFLPEFERTHQAFKAFYAEDFSRLRYSFQS